MNTDLNANTVELLRNWGMFDHAVGDGKAPKALVDLANDYRSLVIETYDLAAIMTPEEWRKNWESWYYAKEILARQLAEFSHKYPYSKHRMTTLSDLVELCHRMGSLFWTMGHDYTTDIFCKSNPQADAERHAQKSYEQITFWANCVFNPRYHSPICQD